MVNHVIEMYMNIHDKSGVAPQKIFGDLELPWKAKSEHNSKHQGCSHKQAHSLNKQQKIH